MGIILIGNLHIEVRHLLNALEDFEAAAPPLALEGIGGIGDELEFAQDKLGDQKHTVEKVGLTDVGDAAVNDHAGVEQLDDGAGGVLGIKQPAHGVEIERVAFGRADQRANVPQQEQQCHAEKRPRAFRDGSAQQDQVHQKGAEGPEQRANRRAQEPTQTCAAQTHLGENHQDSEDKPGSRCSNPRQTKRTKVVARDHRQHDHDRADQEEVPPASGELTLDHVGAGGNRVAGDGWKAIGNVRSAAHESLA